MSDTVMRERAHARDLLRSASALGSSSARVAGERDEHVVERRPAQRDVVDADARVVEPAHRLGDRARALAHRRAHDAVLEHGPLDGHLGQRRDRALGVGAGPRALHLEPLAADRGP